MPWEREHSGELGGRFCPGFRISALDVAVLVAGALGAALVWRFSNELALLGAVVVGHFFLFCNVFRVARAPELVWGGVFVLCAVASRLSPLVAAAALAVTTVAIVWRETRKPSYHGVCWQRWNPRLIAWWAASWSARRRFHCLPMPATRRYGASLGCGRRDER